MTNKKWRSMWLSSIYAILFFLGTITQAQAVPSFARQTGMDCAACHTSFPELTPFGRNFKLKGYTLGERQMLPIAAMAQLSASHVNEPSTAGQAYMVKQNDPQFDGGSIFLAGKISDYAGAFVQWTYENLDHFKADGSIGGHSHIDNTDIRVVGTYDWLDKDLVLGLNLNNNPTVQDVWNSTSAWAFPFNGSKLTGLGGPGGTTAIGPTYASSTQIDGTLAQQVAGLGGYLWWDKHLYAELSFYGTADGAFRVLSAGNWYDNPNNFALDGRTNPYWRLAWNQDWGASSLMVGTHGMRVDIFPDATVRSGPTNRYTDTAIDAQYQYISDPSIFTAQATIIHERQNLDYTFANGGSTNPVNTLNTFKAKASYLYNRKYGATLAFFQTTGSSDATLYPNNSAIKPNSTWYVAELDYNPWTNVRIALQYTAYTKIDGVSSNYDGTGRSASDNNTLFLNTWFAY